VVQKRDFTDRYLRAIRPAEPGKRVIDWDAQVPGFGLRVDDKCADDDKGAFVLVRRWPGSQNPAARTIGRYPQTKLADARVIARQWNAEADAGIDPKVRQAERQREEARKRADTFSATFALFVEDHLATLRTGAAVQRAVSNHVLPIWGHRPLSEIRRADVIELMRALRKDAPIQANRVLAYMKKFFAWCIDQDLLEASAAAAVRRPSKENQRDRVLTDDEIRAVWQACGELGAFGRCFRFLLCTGARLNEAGMATWGEIDQRGRLWTLPRSRTKADRSHEIALSDLAMSILEASPRLGEFIFTTGGTRPISGWGKAKRRLDKLAFEKLKEIARERGDDAPTVFASWRLHDLRRTAATNLAKLGVDRIVISKLLNHAEGGITGVYDRYARDSEKRAAMGKWGQRLQAIIDGTDTGNIVPITSARA
jgi:integrase